MTKRCATSSVGLLMAPEAHPVIKGLRGVRKARFALPGRGKSGGGRVIYFVAVGKRAYMMTAYPKERARRPVARAAQGDPVRDREPERRHT